MLQLRNDRTRGAWAAALVRESQIARTEVAWIPDNAMRGHTGRLARLKQQITGDHASLC